MNVKVALSNTGKQTSLLLAGLFLLALSLRLYCVDCNGLTNDEVASIEVVRRGLGSIFTERFGWMRLQTPLHYLVIWLTLQFSNPAETTALLRFPSVLAGALTIPVVYLLGREMAGRSQGLLTALFMVFAAVHLNFSNDARPYSVMVLLTTLTLYCLLVARRTGRPQWWAAFALTGALGVLWSYNVLTLFLPPLFLYLAWVLWSAWRRRDRQFRYVITSLLVIGGASVLMTLDLIAVPRIAPNLSILTGDNPLNVLYSATLGPSLELAKFFTSLGVGGQAELVFQLMFFVLAVFGIYALFRNDRQQEVSICLLFILVPTIILVVLSTTNVVFQRYVLFAMPFYLLLSAAGAVAIFSALRRSLPTRGLMRQSRDGLQSVSTQSHVGWCLAALMLAPFVISTYHYLDPAPDGSKIVVDWTDFRGAASYLMQHARPDDTIVFAWWDPMVCDIYWGEKPPARVHSIVDPLLFQKPTKGAIYWLISYEFGVPRQMFIEKRWTEVKRFTGMTMLKEEGPGISALQTVELFAEATAAEAPQTLALRQVSNILRGTSYQAKGQAVEAAAAYRQAGTYFPIGTEYLMASRGFAEHGEPDRAWRDSLVSKSVQPERAELHRWMAHLLDKAGHTTEGRIEAEIADILAR